MSCQFLLDGSSGVPIQSRESRLASCTIDQYLAKGLLQLSCELESVNSFRICFHATQVRMVTRRFKEQFLQEFPEADIVTWDNTEEDSRREPITYRLSKGCYGDLCSWIQNAARTYPDLHRGAVGELPAWLMTAWMPHKKGDMNAHENCRFFKQCSELFPYQKEGVQFGVQREGRILLADEMGLGKTLQAIGIAYQWPDELPALVICPSSLRGVWHDQLERWVGTSATDTQTIYTGSTHISRDAKWIIVSYSLLAQHEHLRKTAAGDAYKIAILDECHYIKNIQAQRTQAAVKACQEAKRAILLSGTAVLNASWELHTMLSVLHPHMPSFDDFCKRYFAGEEKKKGGKAAYTEPRREAELHCFLRSTVMIRRCKRDVLKQLPEKRRMVVRLPSPGMQEAVKVQQIENNLFVEGVDEKCVDKELLRKALSVIGDAKAESVCNYVSDLLDSGMGKFLLFAHHMAVMNALEELLKKRLGSNYIRIDGSTDQRARPGLVKRFQEQVNVHVALLSITALAEGNTLTSAESVIFAELSWTPGLIEQCEARAHRLGQVGSVMVQFLTLEFSHLDRLCCQRLNDKHLHTSRVLDGSAPEALLLPSAVARGAGLREAVDGVDGSGMRAKARARPETCQGARAKSAAKPGNVEMSWIQDGTDASLAQTSARDPERQNPKKKAHVNAAQKAKAKAKSTHSSKDTEMAPAHESYADAPCISRRLWKRDCLKLPEADYNKYESLRAPEIQPKVEPTSTDPNIDSDEEPLTKKFRHAAHGDDVPVAKESRNAAAHIKDVQHQRKALNAAVDANDAPRKVAMCTRCGVLPQNTRKGVARGLCCNNCPNHGPWCTCRAAL